jgi:hypothetical protein
VGRYRLDCHIDLWRWGSRRKALLPDAQDLAALGNTPLDTSQKGGVALRLPLAGEIPSLPGSTLQGVDFCQFPGLDGSDVLQRGFKPALLQNLEVVADLGLGYPELLGNLLLGLAA